MRDEVSAIRNRVSVRTFSDQKVEPEKIERLTDFIRGNSVGPFGTTIRLTLADIGSVSKDQMKEYGTYGIIKGAATYIVGALKQGAVFEDFGYVFEKVILKATELGLGTCWLGGTFKRSGFAEAINLIDDEILCAISPLGYPASKRRFAEKTMRRFAGSENRLPFEKIFFETPEFIPLNKQKAGTIGEVLENVRIGPSASNKQPWRIVQSDMDFHFYLARTPGYKRNLGIIGGADLQRSDIGIAMCHFEWASSALDPAHANGTWVKEDPAFDTKFDYIATWKGLTGE